MRPAGRRGGTRGRRPPRPPARRSRRAPRPRARPPPRRPCARTRLRRRRAARVVYEPAGRSSARSRDVRQSAGAKHETEPVWQAGPPGRTRSRIASPSQSSRSSSTASVLPDVSPLRQSCSRERLQNHASPVSRVRRSASSSIHASISTRPRRGVLHDRARSQAASAAPPPARAARRAAREPRRVLVQDRGEQRRLRDLERVGDVLRLARAAGGDHRHVDRRRDGRASARGRSRRACRRRRST